MEVNRGEFNRGYGVGNGGALPSHSQYLDYGQSMNTTQQYFADRGQPQRPLPHTQHSSGGNGSTVGHWQTSDNLQNQGSRAGEFMEPQDNVYPAYSEDDGGDTNDDFAFLQQYAANFGADTERHDVSAPQQRNSPHRATAQPQKEKPAFLRMPASDHPSDAGGPNLSFNDLLQKALAATPKAAGSQVNPDHGTYQSRGDVRQHTPHHQPQSQEHRQQPRAFQHGNDGAQRTSAQQQQRSQRPVQPRVTPKDMKSVTSAVQSALKVDMEQEAAEVAEFEKLEQTILSRHQSPHPSRNEASRGPGPAHGAKAGPSRGDGHREVDNQEGDHGNQKSLKYVNHLFRGDSDKPAIDSAELQRRERAIIDQERKLQKKLEDVGREAAANRVEKRRLSTLAKSLEGRERQLAIDRRDFEEWCEGQRADVAVWRENQEEKIRKKLGSVERKAKALAAAPSRAERAEIQKLEELVENLRRQEKRQSDLAKQQSKRQQARIAELTQREAELQEEIAVLVEERLTSPKAQHEHNAHGNSHGRETRKEQARRSLAAAAAEYEDENPDLDGDNGGRGRSPEDVYATGQAKVAAAYQRRNRQQQRKKSSNGHGRHQATPQPHKTEQQPRQKQAPSYLEMKHAVQRQAQQLKEKQQQQTQHPHKPDKEVYSDSQELHASSQQSTGEFLDGDDEMLNEIVYEDRKIERQFASGRVEIVFRNGTQKQIFPDGNVIVKFTNGDMKRSTKDGLVVYFYAEAQTTHTTHPDGTEVFEFPNGQSERHLTDGSKSIRFNDGTLKKISKSGQAESIFPDGTRLVEHPSGVRDIYMPDGTHTRERASGERA